MQEAADRPRLRAGRQVPQPPVGAGARHRRPGHQSRRASRKPTCSPPTRTAGRPASRCSSSAPARTGATAPTSRAPTARLPSRRCWRASSPSSTTTSRCRACILLSHEVPSRQLLADALSTKAERRVEIRVPQRGTKTGVVEHALQNAREALGRKLAESSSQRHLLEGSAGTLRAAVRAAPHRGVRQQPHPGHQRGRRHDRRRRRRAS